MPVFKGPKSSTLRPFCPTCTRYFYDKAGLEAHNVAKHPTEHQCYVCERPFRTAASLEEHYRGSPNHPNCPVCGKGARNDALNKEHVEATHPKMDCALPRCNVKNVYERDLNMHYATSPSHPSCTVCGGGFFDMSLLVEHLNVAHRSQRCRPCQRTFSSPEGLQEHFKMSPEHIVCARCDVGFENIEDYDTHRLTTHSPQLSTQSRDDCGPRLLNLNTDPPLSSPTKLDHEMGWTCQWDADSEHAAQWVNELVSDDKDAQSVKSSSSQNRQGISSTSWTSNSCSTSTSFHCRVCGANPCQTISATSCGHIFCYRCISRAVVERGECAVCSSALTLAYIFKLDVHT